MAVKKRRAPPLAIKTIETCWWDDDAIDETTSDQRTWALGGTMDGVVPVSGLAPGKVRYRALQEPELDALPSGLSDEVLLARFYAAFQIGVRSIEGEHLERERRAGVVRVTDDCRDRLAYDYQVKLPFIALLNRYFREAGVDVPIDEKAEAKISDVSLPVWVGVHVLIASFRARRGAV